MSISEFDDCLIRTAEERDIDDPVWMSLHFKAVTTEARTKIKAIFHRKLQQLKNKLHHDTERISV